MKLAPNRRDFAADRALVGCMLDIARLEPSKHVAHQLRLSRGHAMVKDAARERAIECIPIVARRHVRPAPPARRYFAVSFRHVQSV